MFNVLDRLDKVRKDYPKKYYLHNLQSNLSISSFIFFAKICVSQPAYSSKCQLEVKRLEDGIKLLN